MVSDIIAGQDSSGKPFKPNADYLFPQDTSHGANPHFHTSLLALTKKLHAKDARPLDPGVPRGTKWQGERETQLL